MACTPLPALSSVPAGYVAEPFAEITLATGDTLLVCPGIALAQFEINGPQLFASTYIKCHTATRTLSSAVPDFTSDTRLPFAVSCVASASGNFPEICPIVLKNDQGSATVYAAKPIANLCPSDKVGQLADGTLFTQVDCGAPIENPPGVKTTSYTLTKTDGTKVTTQVVDPPGFAVKCVAKADSHATDAQLWTISYYYNWALGVHAFCADSSCISAIQSNGIGYDMTNGKGPMGRAIAESQIGTIRTMCQTGSANLKNLGFTKSGFKYLHNLDGNGLKQGWVATVYGACGATLPIKRWKSRFTDDMMYGENLEGNTWYQGMVQDDNQVQFYLWY